MTQSAPHHATPPSRSLHPDDQGTAEWSSCIHKMDNSSTGGKGALPPKIQNKDETELFVVAFGGSGLIELIAGLQVSNRCGMENELNA